MTASQTEQWVAWKILKARLDAKLDDARVEDYAGRVDHPTTAGASEALGLPVDRVRASIRRLAAKYGFSETPTQPRLWEVLS